MEDFLPLLQKKRIRHSAHPEKHTYESPLFLLDQDSEKNIFIQTVNKKLQPVEVDYHLFHGHLFHALRQLEHIREEREDKIAWKPSEERIYLKDYPLLVYTLLKCNNLVNFKGETISLSENQAYLHLQLDKKKKEISSSIQLYNTEGEQKDFAFLSDVYVLCGQQIFPINSIGENFSLLPYFVTSFPEQLLEKYLSLFYSNIENVELDFEDYQLVYGEKAVETQPTIIFEKVDTDNALFLRVLQTVPNSDVDFLQKFEPFYLASVNMNHQVVLRPVTYTPNEETVDQLYKLIALHAPDKKGKKEIYQEDNLIIVPAEVASPFLLQGLPTLLRSYVLLGMEKLKEYKLKPAFPKLHANLSSGIDFLEGDATVSLEDEVFSLKDFIAQYKKNKYILLADGNRAIINEDYIKKLERIFRQEKGKKNFKISFFDLPEVEEMLNEPLKGEVFQNHRKVYEGFNHLAEQKMKFPKVKAQLRPYQVEGVKWINYLYENNLGGCLADDMGLGKTLQTIAMLTHIYPKMKTVSLLVMPKSLLFNWQNEIERFAPQLKTYTYYGNERDMKKAKKAHLIMTTYAIVRNDIETFSKEKFHYLILDESQNIKNVSAQSTQAIHLLHAEHRLALSGTPIENNLTEIYSLFRFLNPTMFGTLEDFNSRYTYPVQHDGNKEVLMQLRRKIFPFLLRRMKKDVLKDLPERIEQTLYVEMEPQQAKYYEERRRFYYQQINENIASEGIQKSQFIMFQALNELRRIASVPESMTDGQIASPKLGLLLDSLLETVENGHKVVVFFNYIAGIELVSEKLNEYGIDFACMTGSTHDRKGVIERFQKVPQCKVLLMTLKTGGVGLNLTIADTVFIFEPWWNKAAEEQAINRLHRFGQTSNVLSYSMITKGTIEEKIRLLQEQKAELFAGLIGNDASSTKHLTEDDIHFILG